MSLLRMSLISAFLLAVAGCSSSPLPLARDSINEPRATREFLRGAAHWRILASETSADVIACVEGWVVFNEETETQEPVCRQDTEGLAGLPIYIERAGTATPFGRVFHEFLTTALVQGGQTVTMDPDGALIVRWRLSFVKRIGPCRRTRCPAPTPCWGRGSGP